MKIIQHEQDRKKFTICVERILDRYQIKRETLFSRTKNRVVVSGRHLLFFLASQEGITYHDIKEFLEEEGMMLKESSICYGIKKVNDSIKEDDDMKHIITSLQS